jgi:predicted dehydrogenase
MKTHVVVVGCGHLGALHIAKLQTIPEVQVVGAVDIHPAVCRRITETFHIPTHTDLHAFKNQAHAAVVASNTPTHASVCMQAMRLGWHVLVEKPIAHTLEEAETLVAYAHTQGVLLQVGHTERFNPAVMKALSLLHTPRYVTAERLGPFTGRSTDTDVVLDLMIHDLDIVATLFNSEPVEFRAVGVPVLTQAVDMASARIQCANGCVAQLSAGRVSLEAKRKIRVFTPERYMSIDCATRTIQSVIRHPAVPGEEWPSVSGEPIEVENHDALLAQDTHFIHCIRHHQTPQVDGHAGLRALTWALGVKKAMAQNP